VKLIQYTQSTHAFKRNSYTRI